MATPKSDHYSGIRLRERRPQHAVVADNGQVAVDLFRDHADEIALVLLDITMPVMGGEEAFRQIRIDLPP